MSRRRNPFPPAPLPLPAAPVAGCEQEGRQTDRQTAARPDKAVVRRKTGADVTLVRPELRLAGLHTQRLRVNPADIAPLRALVPYRRPPSP